MPTPPKIEFRRGQVLMVNALVTRAIHYISNKETMGISDAHAVKLLLRVCEICESKLPSVNYDFWFDNEQ